MNTKQLYNNLCKPKLADLLETLKLDKIYESAQGSFLYDSEGNADLDLVSGFGVTTLGHNHPQLIQTAMNCLANNCAINSQTTIRSETAKLAEKLNELLPGSDEYILHLSNSGTESVEAAIKHAYKVHLDNFRREYERVSRVINDFYYFVENNNLELAFPGENDDLVDFRNEIDEHNLTEFESFQNHPIMVALKGGYHGKTASSLKVTFNKSYREGFEGLSAIQPAFIDINSPKRLTEVINNNKCKYLYPVLEDNNVVLKESNLTKVFSFILELVLGEGGIVPIPDLVMESLATIKQETKIPFIIDEIQTGCGRLGSVYAYTDTPFSRSRPEYITLSKALGGGIAKIGATLIRKDIYDPNFGILHTSTFAEDDFSSQIALKTIELISSDEINIKQLIKNKSQYLFSELEKLKTTFPNLIKDVRGKGLMICIELSEFQSSSPFFRASGKQGVLSLLIASYLLNYHNIRVFSPITTMLKGNPGKSRLSMLRIQPSALIDINDLQRFITALNEVFIIIEANNEYCLMAHLTGIDVSTEDRTNPKQFSASSPQMNESRHIDSRVGFIVHPTELRYLMTYYFPSFNAYIWNKTTMLNWWNRISRFLEPVHVKSHYITFNDYVVENNLILVPYMPEYLMSETDNKILQEIRDKIEDAVTIAKEIGDDNIPVSMVGLGAFSSIVTFNGESINDYEVPITTGNAYTAALTIQGIIKALELNKYNKSLDECTVAIIGATGNIGMVLSQILSQKANHICLIGSENNNSELRLRVSMQQCILEILKLIQQEIADDININRSRLKGLGFELYRWIDLHKTKDNISLIWESISSGKSVALNLVRKLESAYTEYSGKTLFPGFKISNSLDDVINADIVAVATNSSDRELIRPEMLKPGAIVCCASVPSNLSKKFEKCDNLHMVFDGGLATLPENSKIDFVGMPGDDLSYGCLAETLILGFEGHNHSFCKGNLSIDHVYQIMNMANRYGFELGRLTLGNKLLENSVA